MSLDFRDGVSILKLIIYLPYLFASIFVCFRQGFMKGSGWIYLSIFCLIRIIGASAQLASINSQSTTPYTIAAICDAIGLSPLLLASLGLISRAYYSMLQSPWKGLLFSMTVIRIPQIVTTVAGILCIVGATSASSITKFTSESTVHIGIILYVVSYILLLMLTIIASALYLKHHQGENALILAVILSLPFLLIRLLYPLISCFASHAASFNLITGSVGIYLGMSVLEEIVVVAIYTITGIKIQVVPRDVQTGGTGQRVAYRAGRGDFGSGRLGIFSLVMAGVNGLAGLGKERVVPEVEKRMPGPRSGYTERSVRARQDTGMC